MSLEHAPRPIGQYPFLFVVGAPRSGTSWLHQMLAAHPEVAATEREELTVFSRYLAPWASNYALEERNNAAGKWRQGVPCVVGPAEFEAEMHRFIALVYGRLLERRPAATIILDKHPNYSNHIALIARLLPNSRFIHLIRDGREVAVSMMSVRQRVGHSPGEVRGAAQEWHRCLTNARHHGEHLGPDRYMEVRYEAMRQDAVPHIRSICAFAGISDDPDLVERLVADLHISRKQVSHGDERLNRLRERPGAIWREGLTLRERYILDRMVGPLLQRLGYAEPGWWALNAWQRLAMIPYGSFAKLRRTASELRRIWSTPAELRLP